MFRYSILRHNCCAESKHLKGHLVFRPLFVWNFFADRSFYNIHQSRNGSNSSNNSCNSIVTIFPKKKCKSEHLWNILPQYFILSVLAMLSIWALNLLISVFVELRARSHLRNINLKTSLGYILQKLQIFGIHIHHSSNSQLEKEL